MVNFSLGNTNSKHPPSDVKTLFRRVTCIHLFVYGVSFIWLITNKQYNTISTDSSYFYCIKLIPLFLVKFRNYCGNNTNKSIDWCTVWMPFVSQRQFPISLVLGWTGILGPYTLVLVVASARVKLSDLYSRTKTKKTLFYIFRILFFY